MTETLVEESGAESCSGSTCNDSNTSSENAFKMSPVEEVSNSCPSGPPGLTPEDPLEDEAARREDVGTVVVKAKKAAQSLWVLIHAQVSRRSVKIEKIGKESRTFETNCLLGTGRIVVMDAIPVRIRGVRRPKKSYFTSKLVLLGLMEPDALTTTMGVNRLGSFWSTIKSAGKSVRSRLEWGDV
jgi:hypothetical protein